MYDKCTRFKDHRNSHKENPKRILIRGFFGFWGLNCGIPFVIGWGGVPLNNISLFFPLTQKSPCFEHRASLFEAFFDINKHSYIDHFIIYQFTQSALHVSNNIYRILLYINTYKLALFYSLLVVLISITLSTVVTSTPRRTLCDLDV